MMWPLPSQPGVGHLDKEQREKGGVGQGTKSEYFPIFIWFDQVVLQYQKLSNLADALMHALLTLCSCSDQAVMSGSPVQAKSIAKFLTFHLATSSGQNLSVTLFSHPN